MTLILEINNEEYPDLIDLSATAALDRFVRTFSFTMASDIFYDSSSRLGIGSEVLVKADGVSIVTGFIDSFNQSYSSKNDTVTVKGRSKTADLVDSTIGNDVQFSGQVNLKTVAEKLVSSLTQISLPLTPGEQPLSIKVIVDDSINDFLANEELNEEIGQSYFGVLEKFSRKRQTLLTDNGTGDIVFTKGHGQGRGSAKFGLQNVVGGRNNNIKSATRSCDDSARFNLYDANSQPIAGIIKRIDTIRPNNLVTGEGKVIDPGMRSSRKFVFVAENPSDSSESQDRAFWEANVRQARSFVYTATVSGHSLQRGRSSFVWEPNNSVQVRDEKARIPGTSTGTSNLLITMVSYSQNNTTGSQSVITCVPDFAYNLDALPPNDPFTPLPAGPRDGNN